MLVNYVYFYKVIVYCTPSDVTLPDESDINV